MKDPSSDQDGAYVAADCVLLATISKEVTRCCHENIVPAAVYSSSFTIYQNLLCFSAQVPKKGDKQAIKEAMEANQKGICYINTKQLDGETNVSAP